MSKARLVGAAALPLIVLSVIALSAGRHRPEAEAEHSIEAAFAQPDHPSYIHGRVTTASGETFEGRLRWGRGEEAFWGDYYNGRKASNPWAGRVPPGRLRGETRTRSFLGIDLGEKEEPLQLDRPFMARFGDISFIELDGKVARVTLKSGAVFELDRMGSGDFDDVLRVWDAEAGIVDLEPRQVRSIELLPGSAPPGETGRLHGTVKTALGDFRGFLQWNRQSCLGSDVLRGRADGEPVEFRFDTIRSLARVSGKESRVTLTDGSDVELSEFREVGEGNRGTYVDDPRYGRVLIAWSALERIDFEPGPSGPGYEDFPIGGPLTGMVTLLDGKTHDGRLVFDLDESETTDTLDAPFDGVDYTIPFGLVASIVPHRAEVTLHRGETLRLEKAGDLSLRNGGLLVIAEDENAEYVTWTDIQQIDFDRPLATQPPIEGGDG